MIEVIVSPKKDLGVVPIAKSASTATRNMLYAMGWESILLSDYDGDFIVPIRDLESKLRSETEDDLRFIGILDSIQKLCMENVTDVCYNNYKWFHNGFHDFMIEKNKPKIAELKRIVANL